LYSLVGLLLRVAGLEAISNKHTYDTALIAFRINKPSRST